MSLYQEIILDHYKNPRNFGEISHPTNKAESFNPLCGDKITMQLIIDKKKIKDIKFSGVGCAISTASASMITEHVMGKTAEEAKQLTSQDIQDMLQIEVGPVRMKCALLPLEVLKKAIR